MWCMRWRMGECRDIDALVRVKYIMIFDTFVIIAPGNYCVKSNLKRSAYDFISWK